MKCFLMFSLFSSDLKFGRLKATNDEGKRQSPLTGDGSFLPSLGDTKKIVADFHTSTIVSKETRKVKQEVDTRPICIVCEFIHWKVILASLTKVANSEYVLLLHSLLLQYENWQSLHWCIATSNAVHSAWWVLSARTVSLSAGVSL